MDIMRCPKCGNEMIQRQCYWNCLKCGWTWPEKAEKDIQNPPSQSLIIRLKVLTKSVQEGSEKLCEIAEAKTHNPRSFLAKAILEDMAGKYEELGGLLRAIDAKREEIF